MRDHSTWGYAIPDDHESIVIPLRLPRQLVAIVKSLTTTERGVAMTRGLSPEFPWPEFDRLQRFEAAVKTAQNTLGETP